MKFGLYVFVIFVLVVVFLVSTSASIVCMVSLRVLTILCVGQAPLKVVDVE